MTRGPGLARWYLGMKRVVIDAGFAGEIAWQARAADRPVTARWFAEEATWVVMSAGLSERAVARSFPSVSKVLHEFDLTAILRDPKCRPRVLSVFNHAAKVDAVLTIVRFAHEQGDDRIRELVEVPDVEVLLGLPYI